MIEQLDENPQQIGSEERISEIGDQEVSKVIDEVIIDDMKSRELTPLELTVLSRRLGFGKKDIKMPTLAQLEKELHLKRGEAGRIERSAWSKLRAQVETKD